MTEDVQRFYTSLLEEVSNRAVATNEHTRTVFVEEICRRLAESDNLQVITPCFFDGRGHRRRKIGLDGYSDELILLDGELQVVIAELSQGPVAQELGTAEVNTLIAKAVGFVDDALNGRLSETLEPSTPAADLALSIMEKKGRIRTLRVALLTNFALGARVRVVDRETIAGVKVEYTVWDLNRIFQLSASGAREPSDIDLTKIVPNGLSALRAGIGDAGYAAYLCVVPGAVLATIYDELGTRILEGNVRAFLSAKGTVNKGIRRTITEEPFKFFAFNNGITATASDATVVEGDHGCRITRLLDLQIVNGGQTTASLFNALSKDKADLSQVFVQMKLSVLNAEAAQTMIPEISRYANTQNKVSEADLFANHAFHRRVEELSRRIWAAPKPGSQQGTHWFYERARAQYLTEQLKLTPAKQAVFAAQNPKDQLITKTDLAKLENTWAMLPHAVSFGAQKNFARYASVASKAFEERPHDFNDRWFHHLVAKALLFREAERLVSKATWYRQGYRANIVTYALARLVALIQKETPGHVLDLDDIWKTQRVPDVVADQILLCAEVAQAVIIAPVAPWTNVTEWAKKEDCWVRLQNAQVPVHAELFKHLKPIAEERVESRDARGLAKEDEKISAQAQVLKLASEGYWGRVLASKTSRRVLSHTEHELIIKFASNTKWIPTDKQAERLMDAYNRLEAEGLD